jgi:mono/diheme cytochrome c family protein
MRRPGALTAAIAAVLMCATAAAQERPRFTPEQIRSGADIYERNCSPCHGSRMQDPQGAFDLRKFPHGERERFIQSVTRGKNQMPPWGGLLKQEDIEALWAYVVSAEDLYGH